MKRLLVVLVIGVAIIAFSIYQNGASISSIEQLKKKTERISKLEDYDSFNPHADIKLFILRSYPSLLREAEEIKNPTEFEALKKILYHNYILENHDEIYELVSSYNMDYDTRHIVSVLSFIYLLPAYLYERLGFSDLAETDYNRFLRCMQKLAFKYNYFQMRDVQNRISIARIRTNYLDKSLPKLRGKYYEVSYISHVTNNFFDGLSVMMFLHNYTKEKLMLPLEKQEDNIDYPRSYSLQNFQHFADQFAPQIIPLETYELYASLFSQTDCRFFGDCHQQDKEEKLINGVDTIINSCSDHFIKALAIFRKATALSKDNHLNEARNLFSQLMNMQLSREVEFLRDDAYLNHALLTQQIDGERAFAEELYEMRQKFNQSLIDAKPAIDFFQNNY